MQPFSDISKKEGEWSNGVKPCGYLSSIEVLVKDGEERKWPEEESSASYEIVEAVPVSPESRILYCGFYLHSIIVIMGKINLETLNTVSIGSETREMNFWLE